MSESFTTGPAIPVLFFWSQHFMMWRPFFIAETDRGRDLFPAFIEQLGLLCFTVQPVEISTADDGPLLDAELDQLASCIPLPSSFLVEPGPSGSLGVSRSADQSAVVVLYVWPDFVGAWSPLIVASTPTGRTLARSVGEHLAELGVHCWLVGADRDDRDAIASTGRLLAPPAGAFVDPAPDGVLDHDIIGRLGFSN